MPLNSHFAEALRELVEKRPTLGLFARCFAEANGDEARTKAKYIALRACEIEQEERAERDARAEQVRKREEEKSKLIDSFTFESVREEYHGEVALQYYGWPEQRAMFRHWRKQKLESLGITDESAS